MALAVAGMVVALGFGYQLLGIVVGAVLVLGLATATVVHLRRSTAAASGGRRR